MVTILKSPANYRRSDGIWMGVMLGIFILMILVLSFVLFVYGLSYLRNTTAVEPPGQNIEIRFSPLAPEPIE